MTSAKDSQINDNVREMIAVGTYAWPKSETRRTFGYLLEKIKLGFFAEPNEGAIDLNGLDAISDEIVEAAILRKLKVTLLYQLDQEFLKWARDEQGGTARRLFVYPPMNVDILEQWALKHNIPIIKDASDFENHANARCVVVSALERQFQRKVDRLEPFFNFLNVLSEHKGRVLIGCNSWALRAIRQFDDAKHMLEQGMTFAAFEANRLAEVLQDETGEASNYRSVESGAPIFKCDDEGELADPFLQQLNDRSLGHPWVAVEMFIHGIAVAEDKAKRDKVGTVWVQLPKACSLPDTGKNDLLFALHHLLIHGTRTIAELDEISPRRVPLDVWSELERHGFVCIQDDQVSCVIRNYPDIRSELSAAGFNLDEL